MERRIYKYNDGFSDVFGDPAEIDYRIAKASAFEDMQVIGEWLTLPTDDDGNVLPEDQLTVAQKVNFTEACHRMLPIIRAGFEIKEFDKATGQGMTMDELLAIYAGYMEWRAGVKKNTDPSPTGAMPMDSVSNSSATSTGPSIRNPAVRPRSAFMGSTSTLAGSRPSSEPSSTVPTST